MMTDDDQISTDEIVCDYTSTVEGVYYLKSEYSSSNGFFFSSRIDAFAHVKHLKVFNTCFSEKY